MASRQDSLQLMLSCVVCLEEFDDSANHIPRLLPCTHTLCESCVKQLIRNNKIECPECRAKHDAKNEEKSFPQNKYLLTQIKRKPTEASDLKSERKEREFCKQHGKELVLFCKEPECQKPICVLCLRKTHKKHNIIDIEGEKREVLMTKIILFETNIKENVIALTTAKNDINKMADACLNDLEKGRDQMKDEIDKQFDKMKKQAGDQLKEANASLENEIAALNEHLNLLSSIKQNTDGMDDGNDNYNDIINMIETLNGVKEMVNQCLSGNRTYRYPEFTSAVNVHLDFGNIQEKDFNTKLCGIVEDVMLVEEPLRNIRDVSQLNCTVTQSFDTGLDTICPVSLQRDESLFVHGIRQGHNKLKFYNLHTATEICGVDTFDDEKWGISLVDLSDKCSLAISFRRKAVIEFRDLNNLNQILHTYPTMEPRRLCQVSSSVLLFNCVSGTNSEVRWLYCSTIPPKENPHKKVIVPGQNMYWDMILVQEQNQTLVIVTANGPQGIHAYNADTNSLEWKKEIEGMMKAGVASDGHGHLFVFDKENGCINLWSVSDGQYQGCLIKEGEQGMGRPCFGVWCEQSSSLIVAHAKGNKRLISVIRVKCAGQFQ